MSVLTPVPLPTIPPPEPPRRRRGRWIAIAVVVAVVAVIAAVVGVVTSGPSAPPAPVSLRALATTSVSAQISWLPGSTKEPAFYVVYRGGTRVATVTGTETGYIDTALLPATTYRYQVTAKANGRESARSAALVVTTKPPAATPSGVHQLARTITSVTIGWDRPTARQPDSFTVYRNGAQVANIPGTHLRYRDTGLTPGHAYTYQVSAIADGIESTRSATLSAQTKTATLADAKLLGSYNVRLGITSESGYTDLSAGQAQTVTWWFRNATARAVTVDGNSWSSGGWTITLHRTGHTFTGHAVEGISSCMGMPVDTTVRVTITVTKAGLGASEWVANRFNGTLTQSAPYTVNGSWVCPGASFAASVAGSA